MSIPPEVFELIKESRSEHINSAIWGLLGTVVGAIASIGAAWLAAYNSSRREHTKLEEDRAERARSFQRQTLIDLQDALHDAMRLVHRIHIEDQRHHRNGQSWGKNLIDSNLDEEMRVENRKIAILIERVADDSLRKQLKQLMQKITQVLFAESEQEASSALMQVSTTALTVLEQAGTLLRTYY